MSMQKIVGFFTIAISILTLSLQISLSQISEYIDQMTGSHWSEGYEYKYINDWVYILFLIVFVIGIYLIVKKPKGSN
jgi:hypothetical protein